MPSSRVRTLAACLLGALAATGAVTLPATASHGPQVVDQHDSYVPTSALDVSWHGSGTFFSTNAVGDHGRNYLMAGAAMTTGSPVIDLGPGQWTRVAPQMRGDRVAIPQQGASPSAPVTAVKHCAVGVCPTFGTANAPAGTRYVGHAQDRAVFWSTDGVNGVIALGTWAVTPSVTQTFTILGVTDPPAFVEGDTTGVVVAVGGDVYYLNRTNGLASLLGFGNEIRLTPTYAVWWAMGVGESEPFRTKVWRVARSAVGAAPAETILPGDPGIDRLAAGDGGFAYLVPNGDEEGTTSLWTAVWDATPVRYGRPLTTSALSPYVDPGTGTSRFLVNDRLAGIPGFYSVAPGTASGTLTGLVPVRPAQTLAVAASNARALYTDDMTADLPMFLRPVPGGTLGTESVVTPYTGGGSIALSGPYVAFVRPGTTATTKQVVFGRTGGPFTVRSLPAAEVGTVGISGRTVYVTNGTRARLIDVVTNTVIDLGRAYVGVFGRYAVTLNYDTAEIRRRDLVTGTVQTIHSAIAGCTTNCVDEERAQVAVWGDDVVYAFQHSGTGRPPTIGALWRGATGTTSSLSLLTTGVGPLWYELKYWAGLLLVSHVDGTVKIYDVSSGAPAGENTIDTDAERPLALDGHVALWRPNDDLRAHMYDLTEIYKSYVASPRYLGSVAPGGLALRGTPWAPSMLVSQDVDWTLEVRAGGATGPVVHSTNGTSEYGEVRPKPWDGTDERTGEPAAQGTYTWVLTGAATASGIAPLLPANGSTTAPVTGTVYVSATPLAAPALTAPVRSTDVTAGTTFPLTWTVPAGAPAGTTYRLSRSVNGGAYTTLATTSATAYTVTGTAGATYRFRVQAIDPSGRAGATSATRTTLVPYDAGGTVTGAWTAAPGTSYYRGSQRRASAAGATWSFTSAGTQIHLIGTKAASYGRLQVSIDGGAYSAAIDTYSASPRYRQVLFARTGLSAGTHTIRVRVVGTSGRPYVGIDGVAYLR